MKVLLSIWEIVKRILLGIFVLSLGIIIGLLFIAVAQRVPIGAIMAVIGLGIIAYLIGAFILMEWEKD